MVYTGFLLHENFVNAMTEIPQGIYIPKRTGPAPTVVRYEEGFYIWWNKDNVEHPAQHVAVLSNGLKVVVQDGKDYEP